MVVFVLFSTYSINLFYELNPLFKNSFSFFYKYKNRFDFFFLNTQIWVFFFFFKLSKDKSDLLQIKIHFFS